jgi:hypothetical protein
LGFACRRAKLSFLRRAGKEGCMSCNQHLVSTGVIGSTVMGPMVLVASQGVSCLLTDFSGGRGGKELLYDKNNCDSIFTANRCLMVSERGDEMNPSIFPIVPGTYTGTSC